MSAVVIIIGVALIAAVLADIINTLVATTTSRSQWWLTRVLYRVSWSMVSWIGARISDEHRRERFFSFYAPISVLMLLVTWVSQQVLGYGLIWWGVGGVTGVESLKDSVYFSGVVFFTIGFGELVPAESVPRFGSLVEAFSGVLTTALVIGYLPQLYSAYSEREQKLLTLDDGSEGRITPANLLLTRSADGDPRELDAFFSEWEAWIAQVLETHTTFPMLSLFRSQHEGQSWITALGLVTDAAIHVELIEGGEARPAYWTLRRGVRLLHYLAADSDLSEYRKRLDADYERWEKPAFDGMYRALERNGFPMLDYDEAMEHAMELRRTYDAQLERLIDVLQAPRGFSGHQIGHRHTSANFIPVDE